MKSEFFAGFDDADGMIRANGEAEAREADRLRSENADFRRQAETSAAQGRAILEAINQTKQELSDQLKASDEATYRDGVRVYRNVQAALISELDKQTKDLDAALRGV